MTDLGPPAVSDGDLAVSFARHLRAAGLTVPPDCVITYARALDAVGLDERAPVYWAGRATLVRRPEDVAAYDTAFREWWERRPVAGRVPDPALPPVPRSVDEGAGDGGDGAEDADDPTLRWSAVEVLRHKDLAECTPDELAEAQRLIDAFRLDGPRRRSRRRRPARRGDELDLRRTVAAALRAGGEPVVLSRRAPAPRRRRVVLLVDVSGSMAPYARALLRFAHAAVAARQGVEVFALGTRLTRLTPALDTHDPDAALAAATAAVPDFEGGTRLGETVAEFCDRWGVRGMARGAVVIVLSDGWDRGDPTVLGEQMARLSRVAHRLIWVNPLKATPGYAPLAGGMAAALPWLDELVEGHAVASLERLAELVAATGGS